MGAAGSGGVAPSVPNNDKQKLANLLNASVGWTSTDQRWRASARGRNLTGEQYWSFAAETSLLRILRLPRRERSGLL
jgi:outer membrane receptor protein involved in Fe transport